MGHLFRRYSSVIILLCLLSSCFRIHRSQGGGQVNYKPTERFLDPNDIILPEGFAIEVVASGLTFPTAAVEDSEGQLYVIESGYAYGEVFLSPKLLRIEQDGSTTLLAEGSNNGPWTGITYHEGSFYIAEGGELEGGKIYESTAVAKLLRLSKTCRASAITILTDQ